jgi:hypothetical protein
MNEMRASTARSGTEDNCGRLEGDDLARRGPRPSLKTVLDGCIVK